jgi:hypothetical protein
VEIRVITGSTEADLELYLISGILVGGVVAIILAFTERPLKGGTRKWHGVTLPIGESAQCSKADDQLALHLHVGPKLIGRRAAASYQDHVTCLARSALCITSHFAQPYAPYPRGMGRHPAFTDRYFIN